MMQINYERKEINMMNQEKNFNTKEHRMEGLDYIIHMTDSGEEMMIEKDKNASEHRKNILLGYMRYAK